MAAFAKFDKKAKRPQGNTKNRNFRKETIEVSAPISISKTIVDVDFRITPHEWRNRLPHLPVGSVIRMTRTLAQTLGITL